MSARQYPHVASLVYDQPWAILPAALAAIVDLVDLRIEGVRLSRDEIDARLAAAREGAGPRLGRQRSGTVAVIPIYGVLTHRANLFADISGATPVTALRQAFREALADPEVSAIVFDVDSPGGAIDGVPEFASEVLAARGQKPLVAVANTLMASAAYWIGSATDEIVATPSSLVGSIGVVTAHTDTSAMGEAMGVRTTLISAGKYKTEGNEYAPLGDEARAHIQSIVDDAYGLFVDAVARGRGTTAAAVRSGYGEGRVLTPKRARAAGLIDRVDTLEGAIARLASGKRPPLRSAEAVWNFNPDAWSQIAQLAKLPNETSNAAETIAASSISADEVRTAEGLAAGPIRRHRTDTTDDPWDGPMMEARVPADEAHLMASHAWRDDAGDPDAKASYKFGHHVIATDGEVGAASTRACSNGIAVLNGGRGGANIPDADRPGVHDHLAGHLEDAGRDAPPLASGGSTDQLAAEIEIERERAAADRRRIVVGPRRYRTNNT